MQGNNFKISNLFVSFILIIITLFLMESCSIKNMNKGTPLLTTIGNKLNHQEINLLDKWLKTIPECYFIHLSDKRISTAKIIACIEAFDANFHTAEKLPFTLRNKVQKQFLDYYLGNKLLPFFDRLSRQEQTKVLSHIINSTYAANPKTVKWFLDKGLAVDNYGYIRASSKKETCETSLLLLNKSLQLNKYNKNKRNKLKHALFYLLANDPTNAHCPKVIESLIKVDHSLLDSRVNTGETPLHFYVEAIRDGTYKSANLVKKLVTRKNLNTRDNYGRTPLNILLKKSPYSTNNEAMEVAKILRKFGARK